MGEQREKLRAFLGRFFRNTNLTDSDDIFALGLNSLFAMQLIAWVENEYDLHVADEDLEVANFNSVNAISDFISRKRGTSAKLETEQPEAVSVGTVD
jgi:acyl carrier protein